jgi:hypothetical protein
MKTIKTFATGLLLAGSCMLHSAFCPTAQADQQGYPYTFGSLTNLPNTLTNGATVAASNNVIPLRINSGLGVQALLVSTNSTNTAPFTLFFFTSVDNTNYTTQPWAVWNIPTTGTNVVIGNTNWSQLLLRGLAGIAVLASNGSGSGLLTGGYYTNASGQVFPLGVDFNRPNQ